MLCRHWPTRTVFWQKAARQSPTFIVGSPLDQFRDGRRTPVARHRAPPGSVRPRQPWLSTLLRGGLSLSYSFLPLLARQTVGAVFSRLRRWAGSRGSALFVFRVALFPARHRRLRRKERFHSGVINHKNRTKLPPGHETSRERLSPPPGRPAVLNGAGFGVLARAGLCLHSNC